jgi:hypothetical protein
MIVSNVTAVLTHSPAAPAAAAAACRCGRRHSVRRSRGSASVGGARISVFIRSTHTGARPSLAPFLRGDGHLPILPRRIARLGWP